MACHWIGNKPLSQPMLNQFTDTKCSTRGRWVHTQKPEQKGQHFTDNIFKGSFLIENYHISILISEISVSKAPVTQNSTSKSRTKSYENLVDVVVSGNFWSILASPCFVRGMSVGGCSTAEALSKHCLSTALARKNPFVSDKPLNTHYFPWYQRVTPVRCPCFARDRPLNFRVLPHLPKF